PGARSDPAAGDSRTRRAPAVPRHGGRRCRPEPARRGHRAAHRPRGTRHPAGGAAPVGGRHRSHDAAPRRAGVASPRRGLLAGGLQRAQSRVPRGGVRRRGQPDSAPGDRAARSGGRPHAPALRRAGAARGSTSPRDPRCLPPTRRRGRCALDAPAPAGVVPRHARRHPSDPRRPSGRRAPRERDGDPPMTDGGFLAEPATLFLTDADVAQLADWDSAIAALRAAYSRPEDPRATPERAVAVTATGWQRVMPSAPPGARFAGSKTIAASMTNRIASYLITL